MQTQFLFVRIFLETVKCSLTVVLCCYLQGILGTINSGKSALVHRYLTGSYMQEESPEGRNF